MSINREELLANFLNLFTDHYGNVPPYDISTLPDDELELGCWQFEGMEEDEAYRKKIKEEEEEDRLFLENLPDNYTYRELSDAESCMMGDGMPVYGDTYYSQLSESEQFWFDKIPLEEEELKSL
jgi:hypothetical protein